MEQTPLNKNAESRSTGKRKISDERNLSPGAPVQKFEPKRGGIKNLLIQKLSSIADSPPPDTISPLSAIKHPMASINGVKAKRKMTLDADSYTPTQFKVLEYRDDK